MIIVELKIWINKRDSPSVYTSVLCKFCQCESIFGSKVMALGIEISAYIGKNQLKIQVNGIKITLNLSSTYCVVLESVGKNKIFRRKSKMFFRGLLKFFCIVYLK